MATKMCGLNQRAFMPNQDICISEHFFTGGAGPPFAMISYYNKNYVLLSYIATFIYRMQEFSKKIIKLIF